MALTRTWDVTKPEDTEMAGDGYLEIDKLKVDLKEHIEQDHKMGGYLDPIVGNCDGYHNKATFSVLASDPTVPLNTAIVYAKLVDSVIELFSGINQGGSTTYSQLTENGFLRTSVLSGDINCNSKSILNGAFQGSYKSSDSTTGYTGNVVFTEYLGIVNNRNYGYWQDEYVYRTDHYYVHAYRTATVVVKNGLVISYSVGGTSYTAEWLGYTS